MAANYNTISAAASNDQPSKPTSPTVKKIAVLAAAISFTLLRGGRRRGRRKCDVQSYGYLCPGLGVLHTHQHRQRRLYLHRHWSSRALRRELVHLQTDPAGERRSMLRPEVALHHMRAACVSDFSPAQVGGSRVGTHGDRRLHTPPRPCSRHPAHKKSGSLRESIPLAPVALPK